MNLQSFMSMNIFEVLAEISGKMSQFAEKIKLPSAVIFGAGILVALLIGIFAFKVIKIFLAALSGCLGYLVAVELFEMFVDASLPAFVEYAVGAVGAILLFALAFSRFHYAFFTMSAFIGFVITSFYFGDNRLVALGGAIILGLVASLFIRTVYIVMTSAIAGVTSVAFLAQILPDVEILQATSENVTFLGIAAGVALVFAIIQFVTNRRYA